MSPSNPSSNLEHGKESQTDETSDSVHLEQSSEENSAAETFFANTGIPIIKKQPKATKRLDKYGFIVNMDEHGHLHADQSTDLRGGATTPSSNNSFPIPNGTLRPPPTKKIIRVRTNTRKDIDLERQKKWLDMLQHWNDVMKSKSKKKLMRSRVRKGIPNAVRGQVWAQITKVNQKLDTTVAGVYDDLVAISCGMPTKKAPHTIVDTDDLKEVSHIYIKDTIERDLGRTYPRHKMFYESEDDSSDEESSAIGSVTLTNSPSISEPLEDSNGDADDDPWSLSRVEVQLDGSVAWKTTTSDHSVAVPSVVDTCPESKSGGDHADVSNHSSSIEKQRKNEESLITAEGGQASLRRVLRAYSIYDPEVGYCQGMNFIAGMFITFMPEEQAFWMLVAIMNDAPCRMRHLFGESMQEAHQVLYVAERLIAKFQPKLSKHFKKEHVHITMFATQWLLTIFTCSFPFDVVTRVWDCFIVEGWKVVYRVMLALLDVVASDLLKLRFEDILHYFKELPNQVEGGAILDASFKIPLKKRHIRKFAMEWDYKQRKSKR